MATDSIPEIDEIFARARERFSESLAGARRDIDVLQSALRHFTDPDEIVEAVESDRILRKLPDDAPLN